MEDMDHYDTQCKTYPSKEKSNDYSEGSNGDEDSIGRYIELCFQIHLNVLKSGKKMKN